MSAKPTLDDWRRIHLRTPRRSAPKWLAPAAAAGIVLTAVALWAQLPHSHGETSADVDVPPASPPAPALVSSRPGGVIEAAGLRWQVGTPADQVVEGDWNCDGEATLALLHPPSGQLYRFDTWSPADADLRGTPISRVAGGQLLRAGDLDDDGCDDLLVESSDGTTTAVPLR